MAERVPWHVWRVRVRLALHSGVRIGLMVAIALVVWTVWIPGSRIFDPAKGDFTPQTSEVSSVPVAEVAPWKLAREELASAHQLRRGGHVVEAIRRYASVMNSDVARTSDRQLARAWRARLRWSRGEQSALDELQQLVQSRMSPQLYSHVAATIMQHGHAALHDEHVVTKRAIIIEAEHALERASRVRGESGARAKWWLDRLRAKATTFFSP